eukprot:15736-Heterococcus_DN1.PRE.1
MDYQAQSALLVCTPSAERLHRYLHFPTKLFTFAVHSIIALATTTAARALTYCNKLPLFHADYVASR